MPRVKEENRKNFPKYTINPDDPKPSCSRKNKLAYNRWYYRNFRKDKESRKKIRKASQTSKARDKAFVKEYLLTHPCIDCGESDIVVLEFDHRDRKEKSYNISNMVNKGLTIDLISREIKKCDVRCANCHRRKTFKDLGWLKD